MTRDVVERKRTCLSSGKMTKGDFGQSVAWIFPEVAQFSKVHLPFEWQNDEGDFGQSVAWVFPEVAQFSKYKFRFHIPLN